MAKGPLHLRYLPYHPGSIQKLHFISEMQCTWVRLMEQQGGYVLFLCRAPVNPLGSDTAQAFCQGVLALETTLQVTSAQGPGARPPA